MREETDDDNDEITIEMKFIALKNDQENDLKKIISTNNYYL